MSKRSAVQRNSISDGKSVCLARKAVELELEKRKALGLPIAVYDKKEKRVYACLADGTRIPMSEYKKTLTKCAAAKPGDLNNK